MALDLLDGLHGVQAFSHDCSLPFLATCWWLFGGLQVSFLKILTNVRFKFSKDYLFWQALLTKHDHCHIMKPVFYAPTCLPAGR